MGARVSNSGLSNLHSGGGFGQQCINLRKTIPRSCGRVILEDQPHVVTGREIDDVEVIAMDMMKEQPVRGQFGLAEASAIPLC